MSEQLPINFRKILDGEKSLGDYIGVDVWNIIKYVAEIKLSEDASDFDISGRENALCGGITILFKYFSEWLNQESEKKNWCIEQITNTIINHLKNKTNDDRFSIGILAGDRFCAEIMPIIWAEDSKNNLYRKCISILIVNNNYETVAILFKFFTKSCISRNPF